MNALVRCLAATAMIGVGLLRAEAQAAGPRFEVVAIKPSSPDSVGQSWSGNNNRMTMRNVTLRKLIKVAYDFRSDSQVIAGPDWIARTHFDISAKMDDEEFARIDKMSSADQQTESQLLLQRLLVERFGLRVSLTTRSLPQYTLTVDSPGTKLLAQSDSDGKQNLSFNNGYLVAKSVPMKSLAAILSDMPEAGGHVVVDNTGLTGTYNFDLKWTPDRSSAAATDAPLPGLFTALREQLGLRMQRGEGMVPVVVVEQAEQPQFD